ncbi:unnamed protein product [Cuscuta epithymum]|uniref:Uncharacterized protein n=1 Tax=Cuscuta epithymum TaxID=186058 RepID=A0AAV0EQ82_9ASTE|nr:unnamed protein product [Cuscuta epithymum]
MESLAYTTSSKKTNDLMRITDVSFTPHLKHGGGEEEPEINVFDAKKYFSDNTDWKELGRGSVFPENIYDKNEVKISDLSEIERFSSVSSVDGGGFGRNAKAGSFHTATPTTASSEASWNSQTGLLSRPPGAIAVSLRNLSSRRGKRRGSASAATAARWLFCRSKCPCSGKKSVQVEEPQSDIDQERIELEERDQNLSMKVKVSPPETGQGILRRSFPGEVPLTAAATGVGFSFPVLKTSPHPPAGVSKMTIKTSGLRDQFPLHQESLETFRPPILGKPMEVIQFKPQSRGGGLENRDLRAGNCAFPGSPDRLNAAEDDAGSDASSDLFEIESFSTQANNYPTYRRRDLLDDEGPFNARRFSAAINLYGGRRSLDEPATPSVAATENYPPSEVSIDWSVTTAEGFDRASSTNFSIRTMEMKEHINGGGGRQGTAGSSYGVGGKCKGGGLLSCRHEKAVSVVGPRPVKLAPGGIGPPRPPESPLSIMSAASHVSGRPPKPIKPPQGTSHSARLSLAFAA